MEEKININNLSTSVHRGRISNPAFIRNTVKNFFNGPIRQIYSTYYTEKENCDSMDLLLNSFKVDGLVRSFGDTLEWFWESNRGNPLKSLLIASLAFPGSNVNHRDCMNPFYLLPLQDYLETAGRNDLYEKWFRSDAEAWERDHEGRHPALCDVLEKCLFAIDENVVYVIPYRQDAPVQLFPTNRIYEPFRRRNKDMQDCPENALVATWITLLFMEVPQDYKRMELEKAKVNKLKENNKDQKKGSNRYGKEENI